MGFSCGLGGWEPGVWEAGGAGERRGRCADCGTEVSFERALAHGGVARNRFNGGSTLGVADHLGGGFNLRGDFVLYADATGEEALHRLDLLAYLAGIGE